MTGHLDLLVNGEFTPNTRSRGHAGNRRRLWLAGAAIAGLSIGGAGAFGPRWLHSGKSALANPAAMPSTAVRMR